MKISLALPKLMKRHDATRAEFQAANSQADARDAKIIERFVDMHASLRKQVRSEEWQAIFK
ncbi:MAG: hypothetical protein ACRET6_10100 [Burkholderiales bacterium]